jgi:hypothetical protein
VVRAGGLLLPQRCTRADLTPEGLALCTTPTGVEVWSPTARLRTFTEGLVARFGSTLWVSDGGTVTRWVEDAGDLQPTATQTDDMGHVAIIPSADDALFVRRTGLISRWTDAGIMLTPAPRAPFDNAIWRNGEQFATVNASKSWCVSQLLDGGQVCSMMPLTTTTVGLDPSGIWTENAIMTGNEVLVLDDLSATNFALDDGWHVGPPKATPNATLPFDTGVYLSFDGGVPDAGPFVLRREAGSIFLENYGDGLLNITSTCVAKPEGSGTRLLRR